jgi:[ribosomal protein S5]-alanine N-acetyltransferase
MQSQPTLKTARLTLRPLTLLDAPALQAAASAREIAHTTISVPHPYVDGTADRFIAQRLGEFVAGTAVTFAIDRPPATFSGIIELRAIDREHLQAELSFWLAVSAWGQGYMSEAIPPVLRFGFEALSLNRIFAYHMVRNPASGRVLQKNGFVQEGLLRQNVKKWGVFEDTVLLAILAENWKKHYA